MVIGKFHNFHNLINRHKRSFQLSHKKNSFRDPDSTRYISDTWDIPVNVEGALWFVTYKDIKRYPDFELKNSDIKVISSTDLLNGFIPQVKDKLEHEGQIYYLKHIIKQTYYGNFYILLFTDVHFEI